MEGKWIARAKRRWCGGGDETVTAAPQSSNKKESHLILSKLELAIGNPYRRLSFLIPFSLSSGLVL